MTFGEGVDVAFDQVDGLGLALAEVGEDGGEEADAVIEGVRRVVPAVPEIDQCLVVLPISRRLKTSAPVPAPGAAAVGSRTPGPASPRSHRTTPGTGRRSADPQSSGGCGQGSGSCNVRTPCGTRSGWPRSSGPVS